MNMKCICSLVLLSMSFCVCGVDEYGPGDKSEYVNGVLWHYVDGLNGVTIEARDWNGFPVPFLDNVEGDIVVPSVLCGKPVVSIGWDVFYGANKITSIVIPDSVRFIDEYCGINDCTSLTNVVIGSGLENFITEWRWTSVIEYRVSEDNKNFSAKNGLLLTKDGKTLLNGINVKSVIIPEGVLNIESEAFFGCSAVENVTIPESVVEIGSHVFNSCTNLKNVLLQSNIAKLPSGMFRGCSSLTAITMPTSVTHIGDYAFNHCGRLNNFVIPAGVVAIGKSAFTGCTQLKEVILKCAPPNGVETSGLCGLTVNYVCPRENALVWRNLFSKESVFRYFYQPNRPTVEYVSINIREDNPAILDCIYRVNSGNPTVKVRALAFKDGVRSFTNVVRPETFIEGTAANVGDAVAANTEHKLSWQVSADWDIDLAKVKFEILATEDDLLPLELRTVPANGSNKAMELSWNVLTDDQVFSALLWLFADKDAGMSLSNGMLKDGSSLLVTGNRLSDSAAISYVYSKMGFSTLSGDALTYANTMTRLGLSPDGLRQYAYRWIEK